jgi:UDP-2,3-diacylglucosamine pyrophosphatase LpxH
VATDPHIDQTNRNLSKFNDALRNDTAASFGVILGDCVDIKDNLPKYLEALSYSPENHACDHPVYHVLGNHDLFFNGWTDFRELVGPSVYWFEVEFAGGKDLFISLDTATGSLGKKQTDWFKSFLSANRNGYRYCVILTHTNFFYTDNTQVSSGNMPLEESYALMDFLGKHDVSLVLQGHDHYREELTYADVRYTVIGAIHDETQTPEYLKITASQDGMNLDWQTKF